MLLKIQLRFKVLGRKRIGKHKTYRISKEDYQAFLEFCEKRGLRPTQVVRSLVINYFTRGMIEDLNLKEIKELRKNE